jgi:hypothetical protein
VNIEQAQKLRAEFPKAQVLTLPKTDKRPALDYVSHASVTDRLLAVDPEWSWAPIVDASGRPVLDTEGPFADSFSKLGLWIQLTVGGVTKAGYGDGKNVKEAISDALRNAAMRFGVALDLWAKEDLHGSEGEPVREHRTPDGSVPTASAPVVDDSPSDDLATPEEIAAVRQAGVAKRLGMDLFDREVAAGNATVEWLQVQRKAIEATPRSEFEPPPGVQRELVS